MKIVVVAIDAPKEKVWKLVSEIENVAETITGMDEIEVLERPQPWCEVP